MRRLATAVLLALSAACAREAGLPAPRPLTLSPESAAVAPRQQLGFAARGGAGGYTYRFGAGGPGSGPQASLDPASGAYRAGEVGSATDVVEVVDRGGQVVAAQVAVGARLVLSPDGARVSPGGLVTLGASGGLPPYRFDFAPRGDRSLGAVDPVTGLYQAGLTAGALDLVQVTDAAGAVAVATAPIAVGALRLEVPGGASEIGVGDLNGDGRSDLVFLEPAGGPSRRLTTAIFPKGEAPALATAWVAAPADGVGVADLDGDGHADLLVGGEPLLVLMGDPSGRLGSGPTLTAAGATPEGPYAGAFDACRLSHVAWSGAAPVVTCAQANPGGVVGQPQSISAADLDGNGELDAVWTETPAIVQVPPYLLNPNAPVRFVRLLGGAFVLPTPLAAPAGASTMMAAGAGARHQLAAGPLAPGDGRQVGVLLGAGDRNVVAVVQSLATAPTPAWAPGGTLDPFPGRPTALGLAACGPPLPGVAGALLAWNGDAALARIQLTGGTPAVALLPAGDFPVEVAACADVNGDAIPDLVTASASAGVAEVSLGDGDGGFGRRARFPVAPVRALGDLDGDGVTDVIEATPLPGLSVRFGGGHQLARGPETPTGLGVSALALGDLGGPTRRADAVLQGTLGGLWLARAHPDGRYEPPEPLRAADPARVTNLLDGLTAAELGGSAAGLDVLGWKVRRDTWSQTHRYPNDEALLVAVVRDQGGPVVVDTLTDGTSAASVTGNGLAVQPLDRDGDGVIDAVAVTSKVNAPYATTPSVSVLSASRAGWTVLATFGAPATGWSALGQGARAALFLSGGLLLAARADGLTSLSLPTAAVTSAVVGVIQAPHGAPDLAVTDGLGQVLVYAGAVDGSGALTGFAPLATVPAPGTLAGVGSQGPDLPADLWLATGDGLMPLVHDGPGGALR